MTDSSQMPPPRGGATGSPGIPTIDSIHRDLVFANQYRIELIKTLLAIAAALLAFTVAFRPTLERVDLMYAMWAGWAGLGISMIGGMFHMLGWDHYYKSYRDFNWKLRDDPVKAKAAGTAKRKEIDSWRSAAMIAQFAGFAVGVAGIALFAAANLENVRKPVDAPAVVQKGAR